MKKRIRRSVCLVLVICMALSIGCVGAFAAEGDNAYPQFATYTILGDSNAAGYALSEYEAYGSMISDGKPVSSAYGGIIAKAVGAENVNWCAHSAWRTTDFLRSVGYEGFSFTEEPASPYKEYINDLWVSNGQVFITAFGQVSYTQEFLKNQIYSGVSTADLISVQLGSNDIFTYMLLSLIQKWGDIFSDIGDAESLSDAIAIFADIVRNCPEDQKPTLLADIVNACDAGLEMFRSNFPKVIDYIKTNKQPDAKVLVLSLTNPVEDLLNFSQAIDLDIFTVSDLTCARGNAIIYDICANDPDLIYVNAMDVDGYGIPGVDFDLLMNGDWIEQIFAALKIVHSSERGHAQIAERALQALTAALSTPAPTVSSTQNLGRIKLDWNKLPGAVSYRVYRSTKPDSGYYLVGAVCDNSFTDLTTVPGVTYYYKVSAVLNLLGTVRTACSASVSAQAKSALLSLASKTLFSLK